MSFVPRLIEPSVGGSKPAIRDKSVVLPEPEGPTIDTNSPAAICKLVLWSAVVPPYVFPTACSVSLCPINAFPFFCKEHHSHQIKLADAKMTFSCSIAMFRCCARTLQKLHNAIFVASNYVSVNTDREH